MTLHVLRNAALALLIAAPAFAQSVPELPTISEFRKSIERADAPPPAETKDKPAVVVTPSGYGAFYKATEAAAWSGTALDAYSTAKVIGVGGHEVGMYRVVGNRNTPAILAFAGGY